MAFHESFKGALDPHQTHAGFGASAICALEKRTFDLGFALCPFAAVGCRDCNSLAMMRLSGGRVFRHTPWQALRPVRFPA